MPTAPATPDGDEHPSAHGPPATQQYRVSTPTQPLSNNNNDALFYLPLLQIGAHSPLQSKEPKHSRNELSLAHTHARTHTQLLYIVGKKI